MQFFNKVINDSFVKVLIISIVLDTFFGILRAIRERKINSNIGIDGIIRKVGMIVSIIFFYLIDYETKLNLIGFIPKDTLEILPIQEVGIGVIFNLLFIIFEILSIMKNMIKCKLPIPNKLQQFLEKILKEFTNELGDEKNVKRN